MVIDKSQEEQVVRWAKFVRENPKTWKLEHTQFIDAQFIKSREFFERLSQVENGAEIINRLKKIRAQNKNS